MSLQSLIEEGSQQLKRSNISSFKIDSEILMSKVINKDRSYILLNLKEKLQFKKEKIFKNLIAERSRGKPIAYILGKKEFWKDEFGISKNVLIPRPDTEIIIEEVLKITINKFGLKILDIGTGSGCILLSILREKPHFYGTGVDLSKECVNICKINASKMGLNKRAKFIKTDIDNFHYGKYDLIVSNPPYINKLNLKYVERDVVDFEPKLALCGGLDGLSEIRKVINKSSELIKNNGKLVLEIAFDQKNKVKKLLQNKGFYINRVLKDLAKNDRCIVSTKI